MRFEWDAAKARANFVKHRISFDEAVTLADDAPEAFDDLEHSSEDEDRFLVVGFSNRGRLLSVIVTPRGEYFRIISARGPTQREADMYGEAHH